jgi:hypothetical protein
MCEPETTPGVQRRRRDRPDRRPGLPACGACLRGATDIQAVFGDIGGTRLRGYIVWVPKLDGQENNVPEATHTVADPRAGHYWDANGYLVHAYDRTLDLGEDAWDIYLLYGPAPGGKVPTRLHPPTG